MFLTETADNKIEALAKKAIEIPYYPVNKILDTSEKHIKKLHPGRRFLDRVYTNPSKLSRLDNAKEWGALMAAGSVGTHLPALLTGDMTPATVAAVAAGNGLKGAMIGPLLTNGRDSLLKSALVPAGVVAATTPAVNAIGNHLGFSDNIDFMPEARAGATATLGAGMWALRNRKNKDRVYY